jgi:hypothetical protein
MRTRYLAFAALTATAAACDGGADTDDPDWNDPQFRCVVYVDDGSVPQELIWRIYEPGRPHDLQWSQGGSIIRNWSYEYDQDHRLVREEIDDRGVSGTGLADGVVDFRRELVHTATEVVDTTTTADGEVLASMQTTLDAADRVIASNDGIMIDYTLSADGWVDVYEERDQGPEGGDVLIEYQRDAENRTVRVASTFDGVPFDSTDYTYTAEPDGRLALRRPFVSTVFGYRHDTGGRLTQMTRDSDGDGTAELTIDVTYAADGAVTITSSELRTVTYTAACGKVVDAQLARRALTRPSATWDIVDTGIPSPF